jgi:acyl carrier protein
MNRPSVEEQLRQLIGTILSVPLAEVRPEARLIDDLGAESIDFLDLRFRLEEALGLKLTQTEVLEGVSPGGTAEDFRARCTVRALASFLERRMEPGNA